MGIWVMVVMVMMGSWREITAEEVGERLMVGMTLVADAASKGAVCLDGSAAAYHFHGGFGDGVHNWLLQFEGGGWCNDVGSCLERARTRRGSTRLMNKYEVFSGILSNDPTMNPDFYNWNRVKLRYCDGGSFAGDSEYNGTLSPLYFRGKRIWDAIIQDLLPKGLVSARKESNMYISSGITLRMFSRGACNLHSL